MVILMVLTCKIQNMKNLESWILYHITKKPWLCLHPGGIFWFTFKFFCNYTKSGLPRHRENMEFGSPFFQTGKTQGIFQKYIKICFRQGIHHQQKCRVEKNSELVILNKKNSHLLLHDHKCYEHFLSFTICNILS